MRMKKKLKLVGECLLVGIVVYGVIAVSYGLGFNEGKKEQPASVGSASGLSVEDLWKFTNQNRQEPLLLDEHLNRSAQAKCEDMVAKNYWSHNTPSGDTPWEFIRRQTGEIASGKWGENLMENPRNSKDAVDWWMGSQKHREAIQDGAFHRVGFGVCKSDSYVGSNGLPATIVVQHFSS